jgi:hypothetical protein
MILYIKYFLSKTDFFEKNPKFRKNPTNLNKQRKILYKIGESKNNSHNSKLSSPTSLKRCVDEISNK